MRGLCMSPCSSSATSSSKAPVLRAPQARPGQATRLRTVRARAELRVRRTIPIFPLNVVALPAATVPLMIFEARYRVLFATLLDGMEGVEEGLVNKEASWCGTKRFGMCYVDGEGRMAAVGTTLEIMDFENVPDGRMFVFNKGRDRFKVVNIIKEKPVMLCEVDVLNEQEETDEMRKLAEEVADLLRSTIKLNVKMQSIVATEAQMEPPELKQLGPRDLSFWVASFFSDIKLLQQSLLEEEDTLKRLQKEKDVLSETVRYYSAAAALKSAFGPSGSSVSSSGSTSSVDGASAVAVREAQEGAKGAEKEGAEGAKVTEKEVVEGAKVSEKEDKES